MDQRLRSTVLFVLVVFLSGMAVGVMRFNTGRGVAATPADLDEPFRTLYDVMLTQARAGSAVDLDSLHLVFTQKGGVPGRQRRASLTQFNGCTGVVRGEVTKISETFFGAPFLRLRSAKGADVAVHFRRHHAESIKSLSIGDRVHVSGTLDSRRVIKLNDARLE